MPDEWSGPTDNSKGGIRVPAEKLLSPCHCAHHKSHTEHSLTELGLK